MSCTFGGEEGDPTDGIVAEVPIDGGADTSVDSGGNPPMMTPDASTSPDASTGDAGRRDGGPTVDGGGSNMCTPAKALDVCDPVHNMGCGLFNQCDIDSEATAQAGRCVVYLPFGTCSPTGGTTACGPFNACVDGACVKMCYCDADCDTGKKCSGAAPGPAGPVKVCK